MSATAQRKEAAIGNGHYPSNGHYPHANDPRFSVVSPAQPNPPRSFPNIGWAVGGVIWLIGCIFVGGAVYNSVTETKAQVHQLTGTVNTLSQTVTRIDERQNNFSSILSDIRNDVRAARRER